MVKTKGHRNIFCIESAVGDGSLSIWREESGDSIDSQGGPASRAEKIIGAIESLLRDAGLVKGDLDLIAVSVGPGSYSGIRIGVSTAYGLGHSLGLPVVGVSVLEAMANSSPAERLIAVVPVGKSEAAWQTFEADAAGVKRACSSPKLNSIVELAESLESYSDYRVVGPTRLSEQLCALANSGHSLMEMTETLASAIGRLVSADRGDTSKPKPIYLRNAVTRSFI